MATTADPNTTNSTDEIFLTPPDDRLSNIVVYCVVFPTIVAIGTFGNILTILILRRQSYKSPSTYMQITLAVADLLFLIVRGLYALYRFGHLFFPEVTYYVSKYVSSYVVTVLAQIFGRLSKFTLIPIVFDRVLVVWAPLHFRKILTKKVGFIVIGSICVVSCGMNLVEPIEILVVEHSSGEEVSGTSSLEELQRHDKYTSRSMYWYRTTVKIIFDLFPIVAVFVCNTLIIIGFRKSNKTLQHFSSEIFQLRRRQEAKMTKTLLSISIAYLVLCLPLDVTIFIIYFNLVQMSPLLIATLPKFTQIPSLTNHAINFILYGLTNRDYREEARRTLKCDYGGRGLSKGGKGGISASKDSIYVTETSRI